MRINFWYWLLGLVLLAVVWWFGLKAERTRIETDLKARSAAALSQAGYGWASARFDAREGKVRGRAGDESAQARAREVVLKVWGVRTVEDNTDVLAYIEHYAWAAELRPGQIRLLGYVPDDAMRKAVIGTATASFPGRKVVAKDLQLARGAPDTTQWFGGISYALGQLVHLENDGRVSVEEDGFTIDGRAVSITSYGELKVATSSGLPSGVAVKRANIRPPLIQPYTWAVRYDGDRAELSGHVPSEPVRQQVLNAAQKAFPATRIVDRQVIGAGAPDNWLGLVANVLPELAGLTEARAQLRDRQLVITGYARREQDKQTIKQALDRQLPAGYRLIEHLQVDPRIIEQQRQRLAAEQRAREAAERAARKAEAQRAREAAERAAREAEARRAREAAERAAREAEAQRAREAAERAAREAEARRAREAAERAAREAEAQRAREAAERAAREAEAQRAREAAAREAEAQRAREAAAREAEAQRAREAAARAAREAEAQRAREAAARTAREAEAQRAREAAARAAREVEAQRAREAAAREAEAQRAREAAARAAREAEAQRAREAAERAAREAEAQRARAAAARAAREAEAQRVRAAAARAAREAEAQRVREAAARTAREAEAQRARAAAARAAREAEAQRVREAAERTAREAQARRRLALLAEKREREAAERRRKQERQQRLAAAEEARRAAAEAARLAAEHDAARRAAEQETARHRAEQQQALRQAAEEEAGRRRAEAEAARLRAEAEQARAERLAAETARREAELAAARAQAEVAAARRAGAQGQAAAVNVELDRCQQALRTATRSGMINFARASADLGPDSHATLRELAKVIKTCPDIKVEIAGHTDSEGQEERNQRLSERRAKAVARFLVQQGVPKSKVEMVGYGETQPLVDNESTENRAKNRRIEFSIVPR